MEKAFDIVRNQEITINFPGRFFYIGKMHCTLINSMLNKTYINFIFNKVEFVNIKK